MENRFEGQSNSEIPHSLELAHELESTEDEEVLRQKLGSLLDSMESDLGVEFVSNVNELYKGMQSEDCLVRVESLSRVLETMETSSPMKISDETESHYANAVIPDPRGIKIAFSEGQAPGPVRLAVGFGKTIIGFKSDNVSVEEIEFSESDIRDARERKYLCRHVVGELTREDIRFLVMRMPSSLLDEDHLTEEEKKRKDPFIFRGARLQ